MPLMTLSCSKTLAMLGAVNWGWWARPASEGGPEARVGLLCHSRCPGYTFSGGMLALEPLR